MDRRFIPFLGDVAQGQINQLDSRLVELLSKVVFLGFRRCDFWCWNKPSQCRLAPVIDVTLIQKSSPLGHCFKQECGSRLADPLGSQSGRQLALPEKRQSGLLRQGVRHLAGADMQLQKNLWRTLNTDAFGRSHVSSNNPASAKVNPGSSALLLFALVTRHEPLVTLPTQACSPQ